jgi:hypothetical protein
MESNAFNFNTFFEDSRQTLLEPKEYFSTMPTTGGLGIPVLKALLYGAIAGVFHLLWSILNITYAGGGLFGGAVGILAFFGSLVGAVIGLFIGAVIILLLVAIAGGKTDFEPIVHVSAALLVIMPVSAFLNVFSGIHWFLGALISLAVNLYALWLLFNAMTRTLNASADTSKIIMYILGGLFILFFFIGMGTRRVARNFRRDFEHYNRDFGQSTDAVKESHTGKRTYTGFSGVYERLNL